MTVKLYLRILCREKAVNGLKIIGIKLNIARKLTVFKVSENANPLTKI